MRGRRIEMRGRSYPNLELLEYKTMQLIEKDEEVKKLLEVRATKQKLLGLAGNRVSIRADMFLQYWATTSLGFDDCGLSGQAITPAYTTVFSDMNLGIYYVWFGNQFAYRVMTPKEEFYKDFAAKELKSVKEAKESY